MDIRVIRHSGKDTTSAKESMGDLKYSALSNSLDRGRHLQVPLQKCWQRVRVTHQRSGFGLLKRFGLVPNTSINLTHWILAGQTRTLTRQPAGFAGCA
jgi:hypothetical protein